MPMLEDDNRIYIGTEGDGLFEYDGKKINHVNGLSDDPADQNIIGLVRRKKGHLYSYQ